MKLPGDTTNSIASLRHKEIVAAHATYEGETSDGMKHGEGILTWVGGDQYIGEFFNDEKTKGVFKWSDGDSYSGQWSKELMHGIGTYDYNDGRRYHGQWVAGNKEGFGVFLWPNGDVFIGEFSRDKCHGMGLLKYANGRIYKGNWENTKKHSFGTLRMRNKEKIQGRWVENKLQGKVIFTESNGERFEETYKDGMPNGSRNPLKRDAKETEELLLSEPAWVDDDEVNACCACNTTFSLLNRRHHCRHCGGIFCNACSLNRIAIPRLNLATPCRVCDECYLICVTHIEIKVPEFLKEDSYCIELEELLLHRL